MHGTETGKYIKNENHTRYFKSYKKESIEKKSIVQLRSHIYYTHVRF